MPNSSSEAALAVADSDFTLRHLSDNQWLAMREIMLDDSFAFASVACGLGKGGVDRFHAPLTYFFTAQTDLLVACLDHPEYQSEVTLQIKLECQRRGIEYNTPAGFRTLDKILKRGVNARVSRSMGKTEYGKASLLWMGTRNPDVEIGIVSKSSPAAQEICQSIGKLMLTDRYGLGKTAFFPDRMPEGKINEKITKTFIEFGGRTRHLQHTIMAKGLLEQWTGLHFGILYGDDMVGTESGDASIEDAQKWLAARRGISIAEPLGGTRDIFTGTIYGPGDDHSTLLKDPSIFSFVVPIWKRDKPADLDTMYTDGVPTLPEWYDLEDIKLKRATTTAVSGEGEISWLQNFEMTAHMDGTAVFTEGMLKNAEFKWVTNKKNNARYIAYPRKNSGLTLADPVTNKNRSKWHLIHPKYDLDLAIGVDQSFSDTDAADRWCIFLVGQQHTGTRFLIDAIAGKGYEKMIAWIPLKWRDWAKPRIVGVDANAQQAYSLDWMKKDDSFRVMADCLVPVKSGNVPKAQRIRNFLAAGLRSGDLKLAPDLRIFREEAINWRPGMKGAGVDDILDAASIGLEVLDSYTYDKDAADVQRKQFEVAYLGNHDEMGLSISNWDSALV